MPPTSLSDLFTSDPRTNEAEFTDHTHSIMVMAAQGARRIALQQERVARLARGARPELAAAPRAQLRVMCEAQHIRMQLLSAAEREIIEADLRRWKLMTASAGDEVKSA